MKSSVELPQLVRQTSRIAFVVATVGCFGLPSQALALQQEGGAEVEKVEQGERHIVVTATKRDQTLEVPIAVTVVGQEELISKGIEDITNLERAAPSYAVSTSDSATGGLVLRLRGVGTTGNNIGLESSVGAFIDGFYLPRPGAALSDLYDVQQIELLKGPHCFVSASWYTNPSVGSTWNYMTVHAKGQISFMSEEETRNAVKKVSDKFEGTKSDGAFDKLPQEYIDSMMKAIVGFTIEVNSLDNVFKLSQNRDTVSQKNIIEQLKKRGDDNSVMIAKEMEGRLAQ